jgi:hypothetical protein
MRRDSDDYDELSLYGNDEIYKELVAPPQQTQAYVM